MLLTISTMYRPATDIGFLLHKNPARCQTFALAFGAAHVFYPDASEEKCTMALLLDIDPVEMIRDRRRGQRGAHLEQYINDRPYVASSFVSVAIAQVLGSALNGQCKQRPDLAKQSWPLVTKISVLPCRGGEALLRGLFEPLGYEVILDGYCLDERFPEWGNSPYYSVTLSHRTTLSALLTHLYVLMPVLDNQKHYYIGREEVGKLLARGAEWLAGHPERDLITRRYLKHRGSLAREALARLNAEETIVAGEDEADESETEQTITLNEERMGSVLAALRQSQARSVVDMGCGEGRLLMRLLQDKQFERILGMDVSIRALEIVGRRLHLEDMAPKKRERIELIQASLMYRDARLQGFDAAAVVEVIEHLDPPRLAAFERVLFEFAKPGTVVLTTPNREYNVVWENLEGGKMRHGDHRFEWTRAEFQAWAERVGTSHGYGVRFLNIGPEVPELGSPTQMGLFVRE